jgi:hypothetical protein
MNHWQTALVLTAAYFTVTILGWAGLVKLARLLGAENW